MTEGAGIGTAIVSYIEPHAGLAREFNRWYERDHFYAAVTAGPGVYAAARWVATRACKAARSHGTLFGDSARGSYLSLAWLLPDTQPEWDAWIGPQMTMLRERDRMFAGRDHLHTAVYDRQFDIAMPGAPPASLALDHGFAGLVAIATTSNAGAAVARAWAESVVATDVPVVVGLRRRQLLVSVLGEPAPHDLLLAFVVGDPLAAWRDTVAPALGALAGVEFASPFLATVPGSDTYTDQL